MTLRELRYVDLARIDALSAELAAELDRHRAAGGRLPAARRRVRRLPRPRSSGCVDRRRRDRAPWPRPRRSRERLAEQADGLQVLTEVVGALEIADATVRTGDPGAHRRGARRRSTGPGPPWTAAARELLDGRGPGRVRGRVRAARPGGHRRAGGGRHARALRRAAGPAAAAAGGAGVPVRRVRRLPRPSWPPSGPTSTRRSPPASRRCSTSAPAGPTGWSTRPSGSWPASRRRVADAGARRRDQHLLRLRPDGGQAARRSPTSCARSATRSGPTSSTGGSRPPGRRPAGRCATGATCSATAARRSSSAGTASRSTPRRSSSRWCRTTAGWRSRSPAPTTASRSATRRSRRPGRSGTSCWSPSRPRSTGPSTWPPRSSPTPRPARRTTLDALHEAAVSGSALVDLVRRVAEERYDEGYERGVHDHDAAAILDAAAAPARRRRPAALPAGGPGRRAALLGLRRRRADPDRLGHAGPGRWPGPATAFGRLGGDRRALRASWRDAAASSCARPGCRSTRRPPRSPASTSSRSWPRAPFGFVTSAGARALLDRFRRALGGPRPSRRRSSTTTCGRSATTWPPGTSWSRPGWWRSCAPGVRAGGSGPLPRTTCRRRWRSSCAAPACPGTSRRPTLTADGRRAARHPSRGSSTRRLTLRLDELLARTRQFRTERVPAFRAYQQPRATSWWPASGPGCASTSSSRR